MISETNVNSIQLPLESLSPGDVRPKESRVNEGAAVGCRPQMSLVSWDCRYLPGLAQYCPNHSARRAEKHWCFLAGKVEVGAMFCSRPQNVSNG